MDSLIKIDGGEIFDKLADRIGWGANKNASMKKAVDTYIEDIANSDYDPLTKAAFISQAKQTIKEYVNQNDIMQLACKSIRTDADLEKVETDWMDLFFSKAKLVPSNDFQDIWGRVLARECNEPGSIPRVLLHTLEVMDRDDAMAFMAISRITVKLDDEYAPVIPSDKLHDIMPLIGINFNNLLNLTALGLIETNFDLFHTYVLCTEESSDKVDYFEEKYEFSGENQVQVGNVIFTKAGQALRKSIEVEPIEGFWDTYCVPYWKECEAKKDEDSPA